MNETRWWKCDLQVATPAWNFKYAAGSSYNVADAAGKAIFLDDYMKAVRASGVEIIALADHNTGSWIDDVKAAGKRHGIVVFPGCEITTSTGADGIHLVIIGNLDKTSQDFDRLIHGQLGFNQDNPPFNDHSGAKIPGSSSKTLIQILDELPDDFLAIAPHALNDNGVASKSTVRGDLRWKALHHERLVAVDPGDCSTAKGASFNDKFCRRELDDFPRLRDLSFISTSDAYSFDEFGRRFTWIRMGEVSIEALRQAFLDHESRVLCDWSPELSEFHDRNPNNIRHAWISSVELGGILGNSLSPLSISLHPNLNVIIGGRGSGKSSVVAAIRQLYSDTNSLPKRLKEEADSFVETVFSSAKFNAVHRVQESQEEQQVVWNLTNGSRTLVAGEEIPTHFPVTVISQKELFERAAGDKNDPNLSSRSLLGLIDGSIGYSSFDVRGVDSFARKLEDTRVAWANAVRDHVLMQSDLEKLPSLKQQASTLQGQVDAFSSPEVQLRLARIDARRTENENLTDYKLRISDAISQVDQIANTLMKTSEEPEFLAMEPLRDEFSTLIGNLNKISMTMVSSLSQVSKDARASIALFDENCANNSWQLDVNEAKEDFERYKQDLTNKGLSTSEFSRLKDELIKTQETIRKLEEKEPLLHTELEKSTAAWEKIIELISERRAARLTLLEEIKQRSKRLRFNVSPLGDTGPWTDAVRSIGSFRADAYLDDVPNLAAWLWINDFEELNKRWSTWRAALSSGNFSALQIAARMRSAFVERLSGLDEALRLRLASTIPEDIVTMEFLREDGNQTGGHQQWQSVTQGSPGQRTAAMLAFVLHHGREPLVLDQPEDDLDSEWISKLVVKELRQSRWQRQLIVISHNANIPVLGDAEQVIALENRFGSLGVKTTQDHYAGSVQTVLHVGPVENLYVRQDIQGIMEGGVAAFVSREKKYNNETRQFKQIK